MEFQQSAAIWLQIARQLAARIVAGEWAPGGRIPSVREMASELQVNPNTMVRSFGYLQDAGILINQRGLGFFVAEDGAQKAADLRRQTFIEELLPPLFETMEDLHISWEELKTLLEKYKSGKKLK